MANRTGSFFRILAQLLLMASAISLVFTVWLIYHAITLQPTPIHIEPSPTPTNGLPP